MAILLTLVLVFLIVVKYISSYVSWLTWNMVMKMQRWYPLWNKRIFIYWIEVHRERVAMEYDIYVTLMLILSPSWKQKKEGEKWREKSLSYPFYIPKSCFWNFKCQDLADLLCIWIISWKHTSSASISRINNLNQCK